MNDFYSEHETPAIDTPEDVAKALRFVWIPYRGHWLEMSNLTQFEKWPTYKATEIGISKSNQFLKNVLVICNYLEKYMNPDIWNY